MYNADQVRVVSVSTPPEPKAEAPSSAAPAAPPQSSEPWCGILACVIFAALFWLAYDAAGGCVLSGCENGGQCEGFLIFRTCTCKGLHAGTRCAHHCNVSAPHLPHACQDLFSDIL